MTVTEVILKTNKGSIQQIGNVDSKQYYQKHIAPNIVNLYDSTNTGGIDYNIVQTILDNNLLNEEDKQYLHKLYETYSNYDNKRLFGLYQNTLTVENPFDYKSTFNLKIQRVANEVKENADNLFTVPPILFSILTSIMCLVLDTSMMTWGIITVLTLILGAMFSKWKLFNICLYFSSKRKELEKEIHKNNFNSIKYYFALDSIKHFENNPKKLMNFIEKLIKLEKSNIRSLIELDKLHKSYNLNNESNSKNPFNLGYQSANYMFTENTQKIITELQDNVANRAKNLLFGSFNKNDVEKRNQELYQLRNSMFLLHPFIVACATKNEMLLLKIMNLNER